MIVTRSLMYLKDFLISLLHLIFFIFILSVINDTLINPIKHFPGCETTLQSEPKPNNNTPSVTIGIVLHRYTPDYELQYLTSIPTLLKHMKENDKLIILDYASRPEIKFPDTWMYDSRIEIIRAPFDPSLDPLMNTLKMKRKVKSLYSFWIGIHLILDRVTTTRFCHFNNDVNIDSKYATFRDELFYPKRTMFPTNNQFYTPNVCAETDQWRELKCQFPIDIVSSTVLDSSSGDQLIRWIFGTTYMPSQSRIMHIEHRGSTYARPYDYHQFTLARLFLILNHKFYYLVDRFFAMDNPFTSTVPKHDYYRTEFFTCERGSTCFLLLEPLLAFASLYPVFKVVDFLVYHRWFFFLQLYMLERDVSLYILSFAFFLQVFLVIHLTIPLWKSLYAKRKSIKHQIK